MCARRYYCGFLTVFILLSVFSLAWSWIPDLPRDFGCRYSACAGIARSAKATALPTDNETEATQQQQLQLLNSDVAAQFRILTCSATACSLKRKKLKLDEYSTFSAFYCRASETSVTVKERSCLGQCKRGPCVAVEHEDYEGTVSLDGMRPTEFSDRVFQNVVDENDAERVWSCVVNAIATMAENGDEGGEYV